MSDLVQDFPHDLAAERAVLGGILVSQERIADVSALLAPEDFYRQGHRDVYSAMLALAGRGEPIDFMLVRAELRRMGRLESDDPVYLSALTDGQTRSTNVQYYAGTVREHASAREAVRVCLHTVDTLRRNPAAIGNGVPTHHRDAWDRVVRRSTSTHGLSAAALADAVDVAREGRAIEASGVPWIVPGIVPSLGMLGFLIAFAKVGKTTFAQALAAAAAMGRDFLGLATQMVRVLVIAAEDPSEYTAYVARHLDVTAGRMTFYRRSIVLDAAGLAQISTTVRHGEYGLVLVSSWQAVVRGLIRDENDNAGAVRVVEDVKAAARATGVPWLIDAHSGKGEDQDDEADPSKAMRGASAAAGAADYTLSLRYANGAFGTQRRLSGKGRFVSFEPIAMDFDPATGAYTALGATKDVGRETTWRLLCETGAITAEPRTAKEIAFAAGLHADGKVTTTHRREVTNAISGRADVARSEDVRRGQKTTSYRLLGDAR